MKKMLVVLLFIACVLLASQAMAASDCWTIKDGVIEDGRVGQPGEIINMGFNEWGYNYQAHQFVGKWCDYHPIYRPGGSEHEWCIENMAGVRLMMKWSDVWLSNKDCNHDYKLDRGYPCNPGNPVSSGCPGAWLTNHESGSYLDENGNECDYFIFIKIICAPEDAYIDAPYDNDGNGTYYSASGETIGRQIWGAYAVIQEVVKDTCEGQHGVKFISPFGTGLGIVKWK